jgi:hypothetical protein
VTDVATVDVTQAPSSTNASGTSSGAPTITAPRTPTDDGHHRDEERGLLRPARILRVGSGSGSGSATSVEETEMATRNKPPTTAASLARSVRTRASRIFLVGGADAPPAEPTTLPPALAELVNAYADSSLARELTADAALAADLPDVAVESSILDTRKRATLWTQFRILSGRAFKNLYRDPALLVTHYVSAFVLSLIAGGLFYGVSDDIGGFQNRLGFFFFTLAVFGFSCLSSLGIFYHERVLFMRERCAAPCLLVGAC